LQRALEHAILHSPKELRLADEGVLCLPRETRSSIHTTGRL
jgi:hypothetical protein